MQDFQQPCKEEEHWLGLTWGALEFSNTEWLLGSGENAKSSRIQRALGLRKKADLELYSLQPQVVFADNRLDP